MSNYGRRNYPKPKDDEDSNFKPVRVYLPKSIAVILEAQSDLKNLPISRLIAIALDNEMTHGQPALDYPLDKPTSPYIEQAYADEAGKILKFIEASSTPLSLDMLMLCRRDIGIMQKDVFMLGIRELFEVGLIEEFRPKHTAFKNFDENYKVIRATTAANFKTKRKQYT